MFLVLLNKDIMSRFITSACHTPGRITHFDPVVGILCCLHLNSTVFMCRKKMWEGMYWNNTQEHACTCRVQTRTKSMTTFCDGSFYTASRGLRTSCPFISLGNVLDDNVIICTQLFCAEIDNRLAL